MNKIAIFGAGGFGLEVAMLIEQINDLSNEWELIGFFDDGEPEGKLFNGYPVLGGVDCVNKWDADISLVLALGVPKIKRKVFDKIDNDNITFPVLIHPSVVLGNQQYLDIGEGSIICAGTIVTTNVIIGKHVILNLSCTVGHQVEIGEFSSFMPTCNISGEVIIGKDTFWGTGSKVINQKKIGTNVIVGAGSVIITDIPDNVTVAGVPAKIIKENI